MANPNILFSGFTPLNAKESDEVVLEVQSNNSTDIYPGEPVHAQSDGSVLRQAAGTNTDAATDGITAVVTEILEFRDATVGKRRNAKYLPASTTWTNDRDRSLVRAILAREDMRFKCKANAAVANIAAARTLRWATADHVYGTANQAFGISGIALNIATIGTSANRQWKVVDVLDVVQNDPTQVSFTLIVVPQLIFMFPTLPAGV